MRRSHEGLRGIIKDHYLNLPKELEEFNYYYCDGDTGHVIMAIPECLLEEAEKNTDFRSLGISRSIVPIDEVTVLGL